MYHGGGGFKHEEVYNMPTWMRTYHIEKINEYNKQQEKEMEEAQGTPSMGNNDKIHRPNINPSSTYDF